MMSRMIAVAVLVCCFIHTPSSQGQTTHAVRDLGPIGTSSPNHEEFSLVSASLPFRINSQSQVVYLANGRAKLWLRFLDEDINLSAGTYDLSELDGSNSASIALDINERTEIAGARGSVGSQAAIVWMFDEEGEITATLIDFSGTDFGGSDSRAHAINDGDPPVIAGFADLVQENVCNENPMARPFQTVFDDTPEELPLNSGDVRGIALSIIGTSVPTVVGSSDGSCVTSAFCDPLLDPMR